MNRRSLLLGTTAAALVATTASAWRYGMAFPAMFRGNPYVAVTAINTSGGIVLSRTSGATPCFVQVSASAITANGTSKPWEDLEFSWNFGDPSGAELFNNPGVGGGSKNANNGQVGATAAYVYRAAGTYTVTLLIRGRNGSGYTTAQVSQQIVVTAFSAGVGYSEVYVDSNAAPGGDGTIGTPYNSIADLNSFIASGGNKQVWVRRGSSFSSGTGISMWPTGADGVSGLRIDAYGSGPKPVVDINSGTGAALSATNGGGATPRGKNDVVVSNIKFTCSGTAAPSNGLVSLRATANASATFSNLYLDNCDLEATVINATINLLVIEGAARITRTGSWACTFTTPSVSTHRVNTAYIETQSWWSLVGGSFSGATTSAQLTLDHFIYPDVQLYGLYKWVNFNNGSNKNFCINTNWNTISGGAEIAQYHLISECNISGTQRAWDAGQSDPGARLTTFTNFVSEYNNINNLTGDGSLVFDACDSMTVRYNNVWAVTGGRWYAPAGVASMLAGYSGSCYNNNIYVPANATSANGSFLDQTAAWALAQLIRGNVIQDMRTVARCVGLQFTSFPSNGSIVTENQYWAPSDADGLYLYNNTTPVALTAWNTQMGGADTNANPNWVDGANGNFNKAV